MKRISGWGRFPVVMGNEAISSNLDTVNDSAVLFRGLGRSYGDASLPPSSAHDLVSTRVSDRLISFDSETGIVRAEAGTSLLELNRLFLPRAWASPVSPGTQYVSLGGMVAADVHGKNHHVNGCFGEHVIALRMRMANGQLLELSEESDSELFRATIGGMGLTGHILEVEFKLEAIPSAWIYQEIERLESLDELTATLQSSSLEWPFTMAWIDYTSTGKSRGRGLLFKGRWAEPSEAPVDPPSPMRQWTLPFDMPAGLLNAFFVGVFNKCYFHSQRQQQKVVSSYRFNYPLDSLGSWNRLYGRAGFLQYQCVLPVLNDECVLARFFERLASINARPFLTVIKDCGAEGKGMLSFPKKGLSIALDFPMQGAFSQSIVNTLNEYVIENGGRVYLAKDALTRAEHFRAMENRFENWNRIRKKWDPNGLIKSMQSVRLFGDSL